MILIISTSNDVSTQLVCQWLYYFKKAFLLINEKSLIEDLLITNDTIRFSIYKEKYNINDFDKIWYRRGDFFNKRTFIEDEFLTTKINIEFKKINDYILYKLKISDFFNKEVNKLMILNIASETGFNIPKYLITNKKCEVKHFFNKSNIITKPIDEVVFYTDQYFKYSSYTTEVDLDKLDDVFEYSFFQEKIEKKYELRCFVYGKKIYSIAIFSQEDESTKTDYRKYNYRKPNRNVKYKLENETEKKIFLFMNRLSLKSGSIDFIVDCNNELNFLEINPVGQFANVSSVGNYNCEMKIALNL